MRISMQVIGVVTWLVAGTFGAMAQQALPEHRYIYSNDTDFYGADLGLLF